MRAYQEGSEVTGFNSIHVCDEDLTGIALMIWFRGEEEREDRLPAFRLEQLNEMVPLNLMGKSTGETGRECIWRVDREFCFKLINLNMFLDIPV